MSSSPYVMLLDHDNIEYDRVSVRELLELWIDAAPALQAAGLHLRLRAYGGWFVETSSSDARHRAAEFYVEATPSILKHRGNYYSVGFEFADSLACGPAPLGPSSLRITGTVVRRASTPTVTAIRGGPPCPEASCELRATRRWIKHNRACARVACPMPFKDCFERVEQKQVDVHLAVDLLSYLSDTAGQVALVSDDADMLPAVAAAAAVGGASARLTVIRGNRRPTYMDGFLRSSGVLFAQFPR